MNFNLRIGWGNIRIGLWRLALCSLLHKKERVLRYYSRITKEVDQIRNFLLLGGGGGWWGGVDRANGLRKSIILLHTDTRLSINRRRHGHGSRTAGSGSSKR